MVPEHASTGPVARSLGFPLHALITRIPLGAFTASLFFDLASHRTVDPSGFPRPSFWLIGLGLVTAVVASVFGLVDLARLPRGTAAFRTGIVHVVTTDVAIIAYATSLLMRLDSDYEQPVAWGAVAMGAIGLAAIAVGAAFGARLTYRYGVGAVPEPEPVPPASEAEATEPTDQKIV